MTKGQKELRSRWVEDSIEHYEDETDAKKIQTVLKEVSDWKILPAVVLATALGNMEVNPETKEVRNTIVRDLESKISDVT